MPQNPKTLKTYYTQGNPLPNPKGKAGKYTTGRKDKLSKTENTVTGTEESRFRKYICEIFGTATLVFIGCGTAMTIGCDVIGGYLATAFAFGLALIAMAYSIGNCSGCHINPAVSIAMLIAGRMEARTCLGYIISQILGALLGTAGLSAVFKFGRLADLTGGFGANGLTGVNGSIAAGLLVEVILTFIFVLCILGVTDGKYGDTKIAGLIIGLALVGVHIIGIRLTGTSVNPARSLAPAIFAALTGNRQPLREIWIFVVAPIVGGGLAAGLYNGIVRK